MINNLARSLLRLVGQLARRPPSGRLVALLMLVCLLAACRSTPATPNSTPLAAVTAAVSSPQPILATTPVVTVAQPTPAPTIASPAVLPSPTAAATSTSIATPPAPVTAEAPAVAVTTVAPAPTTGPEVTSVVVTAPTLNVRSGPGTAYEIIGQVAAGERYPILARNAAGDWWQIEFAGAQSWVSAALVDVEGDTQQVAVAEDVAAPPASTSATGVSVIMTTVTIPTYPYAAFTQPATNLDFNWTYRRFDRQAYEASNPQPAPQTYQMVVLENEYLRITVLPELGGRIYQVIFKPTGNNELYQNPVLKPSPWGPPEQGGWLAAGGIEWGLPVEEHGYAWGDTWGHIILPFSPDRAGVTVFMPDEGHLRAEVDVILRAGEAAFTIQPRIVNPAGQAVAYKFWLAAMLAPGAANSVGPRLRWLFPTEEVTVHSRGDDTLPEELQPMTWPVHNGVDYSLLGNWNRWLGFFERPAAHGPFAGVYDEGASEGLVRVFPAAAARGSKGFALGWADPIDASTYTDDNSAYVELHGGVAPTFWDQATLAAGATYTWQETWFPVAGLGSISYADGNGAVHVAATAGGVEVGLFPVRPVTGKVQVTVDGQLVLDEQATIDPAQPWRRVFPDSDFPATARVAVMLLDASSNPVLNYTQELILR